MYILIYLSQTQWFRIDREPQRSPAQSEVADEEDGMQSPSPHKLRFDEFQEDSASADVQRDDSVVPEDTTCQALEVSASASVQRDDSMIPETSTSQSPEDSAAANDQRKVLAGPAGNARIRGPLPVGMSIDDWMDLYGSCSCKSGRCRLQSSRDTSCEVCGSHISVCDNHTQCSSLHCGTVRCLACFAVMVDRNAPHG